MAIRICKTHGDTLAACRGMHRRIRCSGSQTTAGDQPSYPESAKCRHCGRRFDDPGWNIPVHYEAVNVS